MLGNHLSIAVLCFLCLGTLCRGSGVNDDAAEMGAFRLHAVQVYEALHIPNTNSLPGCRPLAVDLSLATSMTKSPLYLEQRSGGALSRGTGEQMPVGWGVVNAQANVSREYPLCAVAVQIPYLKSAGPITVSQRASSGQKGENNWSLSSFESPLTPPPSSNKEFLPITIDLHLPNPVLTEEMRLVQRSAAATTELAGGGVEMRINLGHVQTNFSMGSLPSFVTMQLPASVTVSPSSVAQRSGVLPMGVDVFGLPSTIQIVLHDARGSYGLDPLVVCISTLAPVNANVLTVAYRDNLSPITAPVVSGRNVYLRDPLNVSLLPVALNKTIALCRDPKQLDRMIIDNYLNAVKGGNDSRWDPRASRELLNYIVTYPLTQEGYEIYALLVARTPGNTEKRRLSNLEALATRAFGESAAPAMTYYTACHLYRALDYEGAMLYIDRCESLLPANPERIRILRALCLTQLNRAGESVAVLKKLQADFPNSPLMPDIMFMEGWIWFQDGKNDEARPIMDVIVKKYGQSSVSRQAKQVLDELNMTR
jgi:hypothetical protein